MYNVPFAMYNLPFAIYHLPLTTFIMLCSICRAFVMLLQLCLKMSKRKLYIVHGKWYMGLHSVLRSATILR